MRPNHRTEFSSAQYTTAYPPGAENSFWLAARNRAILRMIERHTAPPQLLVDIGCGTGVVTRFLKRAGFPVIGVDGGDPPIDDEDRSFIFTNLDAVNLAPEVRRRATCLLLCDVIEHIQVPPEFLSRLLLAFPTVREVLVTVPARAEVWSNYDVYYGHFRRYNRRTLDHELRSAGLNPLEIRYIFRTVYCATLAHHLLGRERNLSPGINTSRLVNSIALGLCELENRFLPPWLIGSSLIAIARRHG